MGETESLFFSVTCLAIQILSFLFSGLGCLHFNMCLRQLPEPAQILVKVRYQFFLKEEEETIPLCYKSDQRE